MIGEGVIFFTIDDNNLIAAIKLSEDKGFHIGNEIGIISYNDTPMKEILRSGVTVISTDFKWMGQEVRRFIETRKIICKTVPTNAIIRYSL
jgi:DNA-binding LacI/PurR family transcriptional regulator